MYTATVFHLGAEMVLRLNVSAREQRGVESPNNDIGVQL